MRKIYKMFPWKTLQLASKISYVVMRCISDSVKGVQRKGRLVGYKAIREAPVTQIGCVIDSEG